MIDAAITPKPCLYYVSGPGVSAIEFTERDDLRALRYALGWMREKDTLWHDAKCACGRGSKPMA